MAEGFKNYAFELFLFFYYNAVLGVPGTLCGLALMVALVFDAVTDPLAGSLSDRTRSRWGRRHPYMYASALPLGVFFALLFLPPDSLGPRGLFAWLLCFTVLTRAAMTLYHVPHLALGAELSQDYHERTIIVAYRQVFGLVGAFLVVVLGYGVFLRATPEYVQGQLNPDGYGPFALFFAVGIFATILLSALGTHRRIPSLPRASLGAPPFGLRRLVGELLESLRNPSFRALFLCLLLYQVMRGIQQTLGLHMNTYFWGLTAEQILYPAGALGAGVALGIPVFTRVARQIDKKPTFFLGLSSFAFFTALAPLLKLVDAFPPAESAAYLPALSVLAFAAGLGGGAALLCTGSMMADIADEHELATGRRQEGIFFGAISFSGKSSAALGHLVAGVGLDAIGFPAQAEPGTVPETTLRNLAILFGPGIVFLAVIAVTLLSRYRLTRERHAEIMAALYERRRSRDPAP